MKESKFNKRRAELATLLGLTILGWYDYAVRFEVKGEKAPQKDYQKFKHRYDLLMGAYADMWKKTTGQFAEVSEYGDEKSAG